MFVFSNPNTFIPPNEQFNITYTFINGALFSDLCSDGDVEFVTIGITDLFSTEETNIDCPCKYDYISFSLTQFFSHGFKVLDIAVSESYFSSETFRCISRSNLFGTSDKNCSKPSILVSDAIQMLPEPVLRLLL